MIAALAAVLLAQAQPRALPFECRPAGSRPANIEIAEVMVDADGDRWVVIRKRDNGELMLGWISLKQGTFCQVSGGRTQPES